MIKISCRIRALRKEKEITQEDLARKLGISRQSIISVETGKSTPSLSLALQIANLFNTSIEDIFECGIKSRGIIPLPQFKKKGEKMSRDLSPWRPMGLGRFFDDDLMESDFGKFPSVSIPACDVYEKGKNVVVSCQLPGIDPENVKIDVTDDVLKIIAEKREEKEEKDRNYYHREMSYGTFARSVVLPTKVKSDQAEADYDDGILNITLPKIEEKKSKIIKVAVKKKK